MTREQMETHLTLLGWWPYASNSVFYNICSEATDVYFEKDKPDDWVTWIDNDYPSPCDPDWSGIPDWAFWKLVEWMRQNGRLG